MICEIVAKLPSPKGAATVFVIHGLLIRHNQKNNKPVCLPISKKVTILLMHKKLTELSIQKVLIFKLSISFNILKIMMFAFLQ
ncbi:hypothetical protein psyc5s11_31750 [Clostridium gelidum]|uniref:Uncharacterized protein n=1 Tax=Clostridium gelidum TaxID=704125 RepID=A0ABN6J1Q3_9CLOT|nr:hypothetical protein psyc5s11_31750 [Clostridium gelidum]